MGGLAIEFLFQAVKHLREDGRDGVAVTRKSGDALIKLLVGPEAPQFFQGHQKEQRIGRRGIRQEQADLVLIERFGRKRRHLTDEFAAGIIQRLHFDPLVRPMAERLKGEFSLASIACTTY